MKIIQKILTMVAASAMISFVLIACDNHAPDEGATAGIPGGRETVAEKPLSAESITVRGLLKHFPLDVKSTESFLGHEFMVGEKPIRATDAVPSEVLKEMAGATVEVEGPWNAGKKWEPPKPTGEGIYLQTPSYPEGVTVIRGAGIEASSIKRVEN